MDKELVNRHLHTLQSIAQRQTMDAQADGKNGRSYFDANKAQHELFLLLCKEIDALKKEVKALKDQQAPAD